MQFHEATHPHLGASGRRQVRVEGTSRLVQEDVGGELAHRCEDGARNVPPPL